MRRKRLDVFCDLVVKENQNHLHFEMFSLKNILLGPFLFSG